MTGRAPANSEGPVNATELYQSGKLSEAITAQTAAV
jgi:hypothetical protein